MLREKGHLLPKAAPIKSCYPTKIKIMESNEFNKRLKVPGSADERGQLETTRWCHRTYEINKGTWRTGSLTPGDQPQMRRLLLWNSARRAHCASCHFSILTSPHASQSTQILNIQHCDSILTIFNEVIDMHLSKRNVVPLLHSAWSGLSIHEHMFSPVRERIMLGIVWRREWLGILNWCHVLYQYI